MVLPAQTSLPTEHRQETHTYTRTDVYEGETNGNCQEQQTKTWVDVAAAGENTRRNRGLIQFGIPPCPYFLRSTDRHKIASDCLFVSFGDILSPVIRLPPPSFPPHFSSSRSAVRCSPRSWQRFLLHRIHGRPSMKATVFPRTICSSSNRKKERPQRRKQKQ